MAIALVKVGAIAEVAAATVTPAFGQATTAGNFLMCGVGWTGSNISSESGPSGWVKVTNESVSSGGGSALWYKANCAASETAPTFASSSATQMSALLVEWSGVATTSPLDQQSALNLGACSAPDTSTSDVAVLLQYLVCTKTCTVTYTPGWTPTGGTITTLADDGATKQLTHFYANAYLLQGHGGSTADDSSSFTAALSTGSGSSNNFNVASFRPPVVPYFSAHRSVLQAVNRSSRW